MEIIVNGKPRQAPEGMHLLSLINELKLNPDTTIVELNRAVVEKKTYPAIILNSGDKVELVRIVGGG
jgi:thiamine biosynthesis protein ThiS